MNNTPITIQTTINAPMDTVWEYWNKPEHIEKWAFAQDDWEAYGAENDLRVGGTFKTTMAAKDKSVSFDFAGTYTKVNEHELIEYTLGDTRKVSVKFETVDGTKSKVIETFDPESENSAEMQKNGWQAILDNFKKHVENE